MDSAELDLLKGNNVTAVQNYIPGFVSIGGDEYRQVIGFFGETMPQIAGECTVWYIRGGKEMNVHVPCVGLLRSRK